MTPGFLKVIETTSYVIETVGVIFIVVGLSRATFHAIRNSVRDRSIDTFHQFRVEIGRAMLVGLEFLVAGDVIRTVIVSHSLEAVASLLTQNLHGLCMGHGLSIPPGCRQRVVDIGNGHDACID